MLVHDINEFITQKQVRNITQTFRPGHTVFYDGRSHAMVKMSGYVSDLFLSDKFIYFMNPETNNIHAVSTCML